MEHATVTLQQSACLTLQYRSIVICNSSHRAADVYPGGQAPFVFPGTAHVEFLTLYW